MKQAISLLLCGVALVSLAACAKPETPGSPLDFTVTNSKGNTISLGDTRADAEAICGADEKTVLDAREEDIQRVEYWGDYEEIWFEYKVTQGRLEREFQDDTYDPYTDPERPKDPIVGIRVKSADWTFAGLGVGSTEAQVKALYEGVAQFTSFPNGYAISYDQNLNPMEFDLYSPYFVNYRIQDGKVTYLIIKSNLAAGLAGQDYDAQALADELNG